ncbi:MAG: CapA family protein [Selenomonadaceae bacterium]|nr:CapA family protein [Selenomonadaceae bacterium]
MAKKTFTLFCGGDVNLGRRMNYLSKKMEPFVGIKEMEQADCRLVNLECVIGTHGEQISTKHYFYLRARPEQTNILTKYNIDIVTTANNHAGDYGTDSLLEELGYLDAAGILHAGSGKNFKEAFAPVYKTVNGITFAIISFDSRKRSSAATNNSPGTAYLPLKKPELWEKFLKDRISEAHDKANVVIVCPHWGINLTYEPTEEQKQIGRLLIDIGADAVFGTHAHYFQGVEIYKNRPIIYDAGDFLFDSALKRAAAGFTLEISSDGVEKVSFIPLWKTAAQTLRTRGIRATTILKQFIGLCKEFGTIPKTSAEETAEITLNPPPRENKIPADVLEDVSREKRLIEPLSEPRPAWTVDKVPDEAIIPPQKFGALKLVGYYVPPECRTLTERRMLYVETYWTIDEPLDKECLLEITGVPVRECDMPPYGSEYRRHEFCDNMWPVNRWKVGIIYRDRYGLLPPRDDSRLANVDLQIEVKVTAEGMLLGEFKDPNLIKMRISGLPYYKTDFDDIIYQSEVGKCWTPEQIAKITGGKWLVPPPAGWHVESFRLDNYLGLKLGLRPTLLLAQTKKAPVDVSDLDGAIVSQKLEGLPANFPQLKVDNVERAIFELGIAARKRFQGKVIAVTGSNGKTTTCNMLNHVLSKAHRVVATPKNANLYKQVPWIMSHVKQDDDFAVIEIALSAFRELQGSITYEIPPDIAVVTSIAPAHIGYKVVGGSLDNVAKYKSRILCGMPAGGYAILNRDMHGYKIFERKAKSYKLNVITFGTHPEAAIRMPELRNGGEFFAAGKIYKLFCPVPAEQLYDALATVAVSTAVRVPVDKTLEALKNFTPIRGRGNILRLKLGEKNLTIIDSTKNANPVSMTYALQHLKTSEPNPKARVAILGDIAELGAKSVAYHRELAEAMLAAEPDRILLCGSLMSYPYKVIKDKINVTWFETLEDLLKSFGEHLQDGDTVLIKSSAATGLSQVVKFLIKAQQY